MEAGRDGDRTQVKRRHQPQPGGDGVTDFTCQPRPEIDARAEKLAAAPDDQFVLTSDGTIRWTGDAVAKLVASDDLLHPRALAAIHKNWTRVHLLDSNEAHHFMGNGIVVNGRYITPHLTPQVENILHQESLTPVVVETSEFEKAGGSCFCMKTFLP